MNRHPQAMSREDVIAELLALNPRASERTRRRLPLLPDRALHERLLLARLRQWTDKQDARPS